jgi:exopolysaccharide/PEP-CTERM locus tyrosine autokinase
LERAAEIFDFQSALKGKGLPPVEIPASEASEAIPVQVAASEPFTASVLRARDWNGPVQSLDRDGMAAQGFLAPGGAVTGLAEEFRIIKRELLSAMRGDRDGKPVPNGNVILVTSAHQGDGKTWCAINLAISLAAEGDLEVLLVDADFAQPAIPQALGVAGERGLMDALADPSLEIADLVIRTDVQSLFVLTTGQGGSRDSEYLASARTDQVIASLVAGRPERVVIFDSPPLLAASAASTLASHVGQTVLVVRADRTTETALRDAADLLKGCANIKLLLNGVKFSASGRSFGAYYGSDG